MIYTEIKRSCNSSIIRKEDRTQFNAFTIILDKGATDAFYEISDRLFEKGFFYEDTPDVDAKILAHILNIGLVHMKESCERSERDEE